MKKMDQMKVIILVRHAQSGFESRTGKDIDRKLDHRGTMDAAAMASRLAYYKVFPEIFLSSPAVRAVSTAQYFLKEFGRKTGDLQIKSNLYEPGVQDFYSVIGELAPDAHTAILFSHNPGITAFIFDLGCQPPFEMQAGAMYAFSLEADRWDEVRISKKQFLFFESPTLSK